MQTVLRREEKYPLTLQEAHRYIADFSKILQLDSAVPYGRYRVRSLYFDTPEDQDFFDKLEEQNIRRKIRLRVYDPGSDTVKLEMKQKENGLQKKRTLLLSRAQGEALLQGNYSVLLEEPGEFASELFAVMNRECYRPKSIVEYDRLAFVSPVNNIRLTFDSNIRATESSRDLFSPLLPLNPVYPMDRVVFEVKYNGFLLDYISQVISGINKRRISSSKYCLSRSIGYPLSY